MTHKQVDHNNVQVKKLIEDSIPLLSTLLAGREYNIQTTTVNPNTLINETRVEGDHVTLRRAKIKELEYQSSTGEKLTRTVISGSKGVAILPILQFEGQDYAVLIFTPHPAVGKWSLQCSGGVIDKDEDPENSAKRELEEETGFRTGNLTNIANIAHAPHRYGSTVEVFMARGLNYVGAKRTEAEEQDMLVVLTPVTVLPSLLDNNSIFDAVSRSAIELYLRKFSTPRLATELRS